MPQPVFGDTDYINPHAHPDELRVRPDHPAVRDASYANGGRGRRRVDLYKDALIQHVWTAWGDAEREGEDPRPSLVLYVKERFRGRGYLADFEYAAPGLPVTVYGTLINVGAGVVVNELELWRHGGWEYRDRWGDYVGPDGDHDCDEDEPDAFTGITTTMLRELPLGRICAAAQQALSARDWETEGIRMAPGPEISGDDLPAGVRQVLEATSTLAAQATKRGRPALPDDLLARVARAYLDEAPAGAGLTRRLAERFDRPEPTIRDWISKARARGFLSAAQPGRRAAAAGPRLTTPQLA